MKKLLIVLLAVMAAGFLSAFDDGCESVEMQSAKLYIQNKEYPDAIKNLNQEIAQNPTNGEAYYLLGKINFDKKEFMAAKTNFDTSKKYLQKQPASSERDEMVKDMDGKMKFAWASQYNDGVKSLNAGIQATSEDAKKSDFDAAVVSFNNAVAFAPDSTSSYYNLASAYQGLKQYDKAVETYQLVQLKDPKSADAYIGLSQVYLSQNKAEKAVATLEKAKRNGIDSPELSKTLASLYAYTGKGSATDLEKVVNDNPNDRDLRFNYAVKLSDDKQYEKAIAQYEQVLRLDPEYNNALINIGVTYYNMGVADKEKGDKAAEDKAKAINEAGKKNKRFKPVQPESYKGFVEYLKKAQPYLEKATSKADVSAEVKKRLFATLGSIYANTGETAKAKEAFEKAK
jgi:tetratricopeptide (TPR) repeat protein